MASLNPPATSTFSPIPSSTTVAVAKFRPTSSGAVGMNVRDAGSYRSAAGVQTAPSYPPATSTRPPVFGTTVAVGAQRPSLIGEAVGVQVLAAQAADAASSAAPTHPQRRSATLVFVLISGPLAPFP